MRQLQLDRAASGEALRSEANELLPLNIPSTMVIALLGRGARTAPLTNNHFALAPLDGLTAWLAHFGPRQRISRLLFGRISDEVKIRRLLAPTRKAELNNPD